MCRIMHDAAAGHGAKYVFGTSVMGYEESGNGIEARFVDGTTELFDLLDGADGQRLRARRTMLDP